MKRVHNKIGILILTILLLITPAAILAQTISGTADTDTYVDGNAGSNENDNLTAIASGTFTVCNGPSSTIFMKWDIPGSISNATQVMSGDLVLTVLNTSGAVNNADFSLFGIDDADEGWVGTMADADAPSPLNPISGYQNIDIATIASTNPPTAGDTFTFSSRNNDALAQYITGKIASGVGSITIALQYTAGCTLVSGVSFQDNTGGSGPNLAIYTTNDATAVSLQELGAENINDNSTLFIVLATLVFAGTMLAMYVLKRRA